MEEGRVSILLPPDKSLLLKFKFKDKRTQVKIRADTEDVLNWID